MAAQNLNSKNYQLCQFVVQSRFVFPVRATQYNVACVMGLHLDCYSGVESMTVKSKVEYTIVKSGVESITVKSGVESMTIKSGMEYMTVKNEVQIGVEPSILEIVD